MKKYAKRILLVLVVGMVVLQFFNPSHAEPPVTPGHDVLATNAPPAPVAKLLRAACYDCHSYETQWPWYSRVAPVSWWINDHISEARHHLNFSEWPHDDPVRARRKWNDSSDEISAGTMPLPSYTWMHPAARLSAADRKLLTDWMAQEAQRLKAAAATKETAAE